MIAADFDNDGYQELFYNNIPGKNRLFSRAEYSRRRLHDGNEHGDVWEQVRVMCTCMWTNLFSRYTDRLTHARYCRHV